MQFFATKVEQICSPNSDAVYTIIEIGKGRGRQFFPVCFIHYHFNRRHAWVQLFRASEKEAALNSFPFGSQATPICDRPLYKFRGGLPWLHEVAANQVAYKLRSDTRAIESFFGTYPVYPPVDFVAA